MHPACKFNENTKTYLTRFYQILDEMILAMTGAELTGSISHNFIVQMIPHHRAAIEMSQNVLQYTHDAALQRIAANIIAEQTESIADMQAVLEACAGRCNTQQELALYQRRMDQIQETMFREMGCARETNCISADFMREMIPHHRGAVRMSETTLQYPICPGLAPILQAILVSQKRGIREMECLLRRSDT